MSAILISRDEMIAQQILIFDALRPGTERLFFLAHDAHSKQLSFVREVTAGWMMSWDRFREQMLLRVATADSNFQEDQAETSFIGYGTPDADGAIDVFLIREPERDKLPPTSASPCWKFYLERDEELRFDVP